MKVNREIKVPLYLQVYESLFKMITEKNWQPGELLPSERELSAMFNVDRLTVRKSLAMLVKEGLVEKIAGLGTKVTEVSPRFIDKHHSNNLIFLLPNLPRFSGSNSADRITEPFNSSLFYSVEKECRKHGFNLIYTTIKDDEIFVDLIKSRGVIGVFFVSKIHSRFIQEAYKLKIPSVVINNESNFFPTIRADREKGTYEAIKLLINQNHHQIGFISGLSNYITSKDCLQGYKRALADANIDWKQQIIKESDWTFEGGFNAMTEVIREQPRLPSAVFACNDMIALGVMEAIKAAGLSIPQDISVVGCDDIDQSKYYSPKLTTIKVNTELMAKVACQNLFLSIENQDFLNIQIILPTKLIIRESTAPCSLR